MYEPLNRESYVASRNLAPMVMKFSVEELVDVK